MWRLYLRAWLCLHQEQEALLGRRARAGRCGQHREVRLAPWDACSLTGVAVRALPLCRVLPVGPVHGVTQDPLQGTAWAGCRQGAAAHGGAPPAPPGATQHPRPTHPSTPSAPLHFSVTPGTPRRPAPPRRPPPAGGARAQRVRPPAPLRGPSASRRIPGGPLRVPGGSPAQPPLRVLDRSPSPVPAHAPCSPSPPRFGAGPSWCPLPTPGAPGSPGLPPVCAAEAAGIPQDALPDRHRAVPTHICTIRCTETRMKLNHKRLLCPAATG